jgi:hypothetical protein
MITAETQRTLVKSPPELWGELSDQAALARHLAALGKIRIVASEPEQSVEWEAETAHGKVEIKPSGWGTKVTLSATVDGSSSTLARREPTGSSESHREQDAERPVQIDAEPQAPPDAEAQAEPDGEPQAEPDAEAQAEPDCERPVEPDRELDEPDGRPSPERGSSRLFSRLRWRGWFARRRRAARDTHRQEQLMQPEPAVPAPEGEPDVAAPEAKDPVAAPEAEPAVAAPEGEDVVSASDDEIPGSREREPEIAGSPEPETASPLEAQPESALEPETAFAEQQALERTTELLRAVLDSLGEAHHRPFSRA